jgi:putative ABC transport system permease protein
MTTLSLLPRLIKRSGTRLLLTLGSLIIGAMTLSIVLGLIGSVQRFFVAESRTLLGGDITIESDTRINSSQKDIAELVSIGGTLSERVETIVVAQNQAEMGAGTLASLLVSLKVVDSNYPLYGQLGLSGTDKSIPLDNEIFVARDVMTRMGLSLGQSLVLGDASFRIAGLITSEPDRIAGSFRLGPLVLLSSEGWNRTGLDGKQSRASYTLSIRYSDNTPESSVLPSTTAIKSAFPGPNYSVAFAKDGPSSLLRILGAAERFFFTMIVLALFLVLVNIRLNLSYFLASYQKTIAIMRSLGMTKLELLRLFLSLLLSVAFVAGILGALLGNILTNAALPILAKYIESPLPPAGIFDNIILVTLFVFLLCLFAALGFLIRLLSIEPKMLLLGYGTSHGKLSLLTREIPVLFLTLLCFFGGVYYLTDRALVALVAVSGISFVFLLLFLLSRGVILAGHQLRFRLPFTVRSILNFLKHQGTLGTTAIASLTIALASVFAIALLERNVLGNLGTEFRADAPNIYLIDVQEDQRALVRSIMGDSWRDFSSIRARFMKRDGYDIQANLATENGELRREFNVTSATDFIEGEKLIAGTWHSTTGRGEVSVEKGFADRAKLTLGSSVEFTVQGFPITAIVTSIREVTTTSGLPFFFLVFSPDVLEGIPRTYFGYAYAPKDEIPLLQNAVARNYPNITAIPTTEILETAAKIVSALSAAVVATAIPALALGLILIVAMLAISVRERTNDMLVFTAFGAKTKLLFVIFLVESSSIVILAGIFAAILAHGGIYALNYYVFDFSGYYLASENSYLFLAIVTITLIIAFFFAKRFASLSPAELLRKEGL